MARAKPNPHVTLAFLFISFQFHPFMFLPTLKDSFYNKKMAREDFLSLMDGNLARMTGQN